VTTRQVKATPNQTSGLVGEEVSNVSELVMDHEGQHAHLGGTSLVQLNGTLGQLGFLCGAKYLKTL
jgi:hypothetical protein